MYTRTHTHCSYSLDVTTEELMFALSTKMSVALESYTLACPPWWDRSCDLGLLIGTFFHGLGNYEDMKNDDELPFSRKIKSYVRCNRTEAESYRHFEAAADAAKNVFDTALVTMKRKFQEQTHAAVARVFAATNSGENDIKQSDVVKAKEQEMNDDDIVSLPCLKDAAVQAFRKPFGKASKKSSNYALPLPDSKHLDYLLVKIVQNIESNNLSPPEASVSQPQESNTTENINLYNEKDETNVIISTNREVLRMGISSTKLKDSERTQLLFAGSLSSVDKNPQDDESDYFLGAASSELATIAVGADSKRYQRGQYVPLVLTRFGLGGILQAEDSVIESLLGTSLKESTKNGSNQGHTIVNEKGANADPDMKVAATVSGETTKEVENQPANKLLSNQPVWQYIKDNATLRASLCTVVAMGGYPSSLKHDEFVTVSAELLSELNRNPALVPPIPFSCLSSPTPVNKCPFFSMDDAFSPLFKRAGIEWSDNKESLDEYFQSVLLPHCLQLCLTLAEVQTKAASEQGKMDVYLGRPSYKHLSPLPDPFIPLEQHSEEAVAYAYAILRRTRLVKAIKFIVGGGVPLHILSEFLHGQVLQSQTMGIPVWWCPWIHDLGLLVNAALYGLGSITTVLPLQQSYIERHVRETFIDGTADRKPALPKCFLDKASKEEIDAWVDMHSKQFPTFHVVEHRLALICYHLTVGTDVQYDHVPMFDECGWPMTKDVTASGLLADMKTSGRKCLLTDYEDLKTSK